MRSVDTNVLIRLVIRDDVGQAESSDLFISDGAWVSDFVLIEASWVLVRIYKIDSRSLADSIEMLLNHNDLTIQDSDAVANALKLYRAKPNLGFAD